MKHSNRILPVFLAALIPLFCHYDAYAQIDYDIRGYVYDLPIFQRYPKAAELFQPEGDNDDIIMNLTRFRLMPELFIGDNSRITMHYELDASLSNSTMMSMYEKGKTNRQIAELYTEFAKGNIDSSVYYSAEHYIDMLYFKHLFDFGEITFGRQVISWGAGRIWQPTDLFNPINPANFTKFERDGADAVSFKYYLGSFSDLELVYNFRETWKKGNFAGRYRTNTGEYDLTAMAGYFDEKIIIGGDFAGSLWEAGVRGEAVYAFNQNDADSNYVRFILGADYQITSKLYALMEYQYNGEGTSEKEKYILYLQRLMQGEIQNIGVHYLALSADYQAHPLVNINLSSISNTGDGSGFLNLGCTYNILENLNIGAGAAVFWGEKLSEYWYYSTSYYLNLQFYF